MGVYKDRVTIYEVAKAAGVSLATVSRVINNQSNVTPETKKRVEETIQRLGYRPNALAQGLATSRTTNIGIVLSDTNYVHICNLLSGMIDIGKIYGYQTTLFVTKHSAEEAKEVIAKLITSHVDGAIVFDDELGEADIRNIESYNVPTVIIGNKVKGEKLASITLDFKEAIGEFVDKHFKEGRVTFLRIPNEGKLMRGVEKVLEDKVADRLDTITCPDSYHEVYSHFVDFFKAVRVGRFICPRDSLACAIQNAALDMGLRVPEDVQVLSIIGTKYSSIARPTISSLEMDMYEVGSIAMRMVTKLLKDELKNREYTFTSDFVQRASTKE
jgi:LacI family transcriptional regulator